MKINVEFKIEEVIRYTIVRSYETEGCGSALSYGFGTGANYGEFETRDAAEKVKEALEATLGVMLYRAL